MSQDVWEAIKTFTGQDPAQAFVDANTQLVLKDEKIRSLEAENRVLRALVKRGGV